MSSMALLTPGMRDAGSRAYLCMALAHTADLKSTTAEGKAYVTLVPPWKGLRDQAYRRLRPPRSGVDETDRAKLIAWTDYWHAQLTWTGRHWAATTCTRLGCTWSSSLHAHPSEPSVRALQNTWSVH